MTSNLDTFAGLIRREPWLAVLMALFMLSLTGIPPTAGFFAKAYVILPAIQASEAGWTALGVLAVITMLNAAIAAFYYLRVARCTCSCASRSSEQPALSHGRLLWGGLAVASVADRRAGPRSRVPRRRQPGRGGDRRLVPSGTNASTGRTGIRC